MAAPTPAASVAPADRPLGSTRVLSLTHAVAGPVVGRTLAEQGAEVLSVNHHDYFEHDWVYDDVNVGHRSTFLDLDDERDNQICRDLTSAADVVVDNFRGRKLARFGLSPEELASRRPGIIVVSVRCYGWAVRGSTAAVSTCWDPPLRAWRCWKARREPLRCRRPL